MNKKKWKKDTYVCKHTREVEPIYKVDIGKIHIVYSINSEKLSIQGRIIDIYTKNSYLNFDDFEDP